MITVYDAQVIDINNITQIAMLIEDDIIEPNEVCDHCVFHEDGSLYSRMWKQNPCHVCGIDTKRFFILANNWYL